MAVGKGVVHARDLDARGRLEAQALALVFLRVGKAGVDGQHERRVTGAAGAGRGPGAREALRRGVPERLVQDAREARRLEAVAVLLEAVARERELRRVRAGRELLHRGVGLYDALRLERAVGALLVQPVDAGVDLAAHGVVHHGHEAARAGDPGAPGHRVERGRAVKRPLQAAGQALCRGDANAHARERAGAAAHEDRVHVGHGEARLAQAVERRVDELLIGVAAAQVVARGEYGHIRVGRRAVHARHGAREHVGRGVQG